MIELLLAGACAAAQPLPPREEVDRTYQAVKGSVVNVNLLMVSAQARLKRLQLTYNEAGASALRDKARASFEAYTGKLSAFRSAADALDAAHPGAPASAGARGSAAAAAAPSGGSTTELLQEIGELRRSYNVQAGKRAASELRASLARWGAATRFQPEQEKTLAAGRSLAGKARDAAKALSPQELSKNPRARESAGREAKGLADDAAALEVELELLGGRYRLDNLLREHPELGR